ncbi:MAG TPA: oligopeptide/dipeptide ABC transporter ATP-binding protein [Spirochaetia bacterium]|nr:oligopeptide/dipeptide ABC transporter ATP-binding protein [Spirochaetia bacterium]
MSDEVLLSVRGLKVYFPVEKGLIFRRRVGWIRAVDGVDFEVRRGETLGLVGESGCGKSTTAMTVAQLQTATSGEILFEGRNLCGLSKEELQRERRNFQIIFQDPFSSLDPRMTAGQIIAEPLDLARRNGVMSLSREQIDRRVRELMERVGLSPSFRSRYPHEFSGGQRQRIGIARALSLSPKLLLADEPVSALDVSIQSQILNLLRDLQREFDLAFLFIAHDLAVVRHISSRVAVMYLGRIVEIADAPTLYAKPLHPYTRALLSAVPIPDPPVERNRRRILLKGDVPSPEIEHAGCPFVERCPEAMELCRSSTPRLKEIEDGHKTACFLYFEPDAKDVGQDPAPDI